ncbi:hypothetical protein [Pseudovibrio sp. Ad37]|uniref:hypothetical protein n=1 Tax=Pseudovibrio sp. Ad37 TaxID=989422 RepID=UPI0007AE550E|nr:hypothetical protein [Pseudovibrio sp. Ad37]KZL24240.1 hypothetical protein PsAD37_02811 [Pseudovibrio sp. Ad37]
MRKFVDYLKSRWDLLCRTMGKRVDPDFRSEISKLFKNPSVILPSATGLCWLVFNRFSPDPLPMKAIVIMAAGCILLVATFVILAGMMHHENEDRRRELENPTDTD